MEKAAPVKFTNKEIVLILKEVLAAMEVKEFNIFRIRAYQNAISAIDNLTMTVFDLWEDRRLEEIPGVGAGLKAHLEELFTSGDVKEFHAIKKGLPEGMFSLIGLRGIGAKKAFKLAVAFKLHDRESAIEKVKLLADAGKIQLLEGFGEKSEKDILEAIEGLKMHKREKPRLLLIKAEEIAGRLLKYMKAMPSVEDANALGSYRRRSPTVGDLDIAVSSKNVEAVLEHFTKYPEVHEVISRGDKKIQAVLKNDVQVDLRVSMPEAYGAMMQYFTGSKQHNVILRTNALEHGYSLSEYGIKKNEKLHEFAGEKGFYNFIGLEYIPPELRQGKNEVEMARAKHKLPKLVELKDIRGDIHTHTNDSDGVNTLEEMVASAAELGYEYYGVSDHAPSVQARGLAEVHRVVDSKRKLIDALNKKLDGKMKILFGYEVNILADGSISLPDEILKKLDYAIGSIHTAFDQPREVVTQRMLNALENPYINVIGHPSGRLINEREPYDLDWKKVFDAAVDNDKILEINAQPSRLDLPDELVKEALERDIKMIVNTDAHAFHDLLLMKYGLDVARRGYCEARHIVNTLPLDEFLRSLKARNS